MEEVSWSISTTALEDVQCKLSAITEFADAAKDSRQDSDPAISNLETFTVKGDTIYTSKLIFLSTFSLLFRREEFDRRTSPSFDPYKPCNDHGECRIIDMNMMCLPTNKTCHCRPDMKWNREIGECQIFMDVDCSGPKVMSIETATTTPSPVEPNSGNSTNSNSSYVDDLPQNMTQITVEDTLKDSKLTQVDLNKTTEAELTAAFCQEIGSISQRYEVSNFSKI